MLNKLRLPVLALGTALVLFSRMQLKQEGMKTNITTTVSAFSSELLHDITWTVIMIGGATGMLIAPIL